MAVRDPSQAEQAVRWLTRDLLADAGRSDNICFGIRVGPLPRTVGGHVQQLGHLSMVTDVLEYVSDPCRGPAWGHVQKLGHVSSVTKS
jgi:hypothetical protein